MDKLEDASLIPKEPSLADFPNVHRQSANKDDKVSFVMLDCRFSINQNN